MPPRPVLAVLAAAALYYTAAMSSHAAPPPDTSVRDALAPGLLGLYATDRFKLSTGRCRDCLAPGASAVVLQR
jgi:hypothetical protein